MKGVVLGLEDCGEADSLFNNPNTLFWHYYLRTNN
jgi:hypothetical protein